MKKFLPILLIILLLASASVKAQGNNGNNGNNGNGNGNNGNGNNGNGNGNGGSLKEDNDELLIPLPVTLLAFTAEFKANQVVLQWATVTEKDNAYFQVERSQDGINFNTIGQINGQGTTQQRQDYSFTDKLNNNGIWYYRLKQVDYQQSSEYSPIRAVRVQTVLTPSLRIYPNPAITHLTVDLRLLPAGNYTLQVLALTGTIVKEKRVIAAEELTLELQDIPKGAYLLRVAATNLEQVSRFLKS